MNSLRVGDVRKFESVLQPYLQPLVIGREVESKASLFVTAYGDIQHIYGQKFNKRLKKYAAQAEIEDWERLSYSIRGIRTIDERRGCHDWHK